MIRKAFSILAGGLALLLSCNVQALPLTLNLNEPVTFNFDLTSATPPDFSTVVITVGFTTTSAWTLSSVAYSELDGTGTGVPWDDIYFTTDTTVRTYAGAGIVDGLFSDVLELQAGAFTVTSISATGFDATGQAVITVDGVRVPLPTTLALLGLGLVGMGFGRRKQVKAV